VGVAAPLIVGAMIAGGTAYTVKSQNDAANASKKALNDLGDGQQRIADEQAKQLALAPKPTPQDNYAADRAKQLNSLRQGIAATMKSAPGGGSAPVVSAPTLKTKLGQ
jgi:hypothetical protein